MVGPYKTRVEVINGDMYYRRRHITTQQKPYTDRLPYNAVTQKLTKRQNMPWWNAGTNTHDLLGIPERNLSQAVLKARDSFRSKVGPAAMAAVNLAEYRSSMSMIGDRAAQLYRFTRYLRRFELIKAARELNISPNAVDRRRVEGLLKAKRFGNAWLEYHLGWSPLIDDIGNCVDLLQSPLPRKLVKAGASVGASEYYNDQFPKNPYGYYTNTVWKLKVQLIADISVTNPNLFRANRLGFTNPAVVAWELVPFSFVVDWFVPVGSFLSQFNDFVGMGLTQPATTFKLERLHTWKGFNGKPENPSEWRILEARAEKVIRNQGIDTTLTLRPRLPWSLSPTRAATAVSLLLQQLGR